LLTAVWMCQFGMTGYWGESQAIRAQI